MIRVIVGITDLSDVLHYHLKREETEISYFVVEEEYRVTKMHMGIPVLSFQELNYMHTAKEIGVYLCIGYSQMNGVRKRIYQHLKSENYIILDYVHPSANVYASSMGEGNLIFEQAYIGPYVEMGICNICYPKSLIAHHTTVGDYNFFAINSSIAGDVQIENQCFFGNSSLTRDKIFVGSRVLAGAGAYVAVDAEDDSVIVPQRSKCLSGKKSTEFL